MHGMAWQGNSGEGVGESKRQGMHPERGTATEPLSEVRSPQSAQTRLGHNSTQSQQAGRQGDQYKPWGGRGTVRGRRVQNFTSPASRRYVSYYLTGILQLTPTTRATYLPGSGDAYADGNGVDRAQGRRLAAPGFESDC